MIRTPSESEIMNAVTSFRHALDKVDREIWRNVGVESFPRGACQRVSHMVAKFLMAEFDIALIYVHADFEGHDHGWLEWDGLTIDATGDQFGWPSVIVERRSSWHAEAREEQRDPICFELEWWRPYCAPVWEKAAQILTSKRRAFWQE